jgi:hypothetical protein
MLTFDEIRTELGKVTYRDQWRFVLYPHPYEGIWLSIIAELPDADHPGKTRVNNMRVALPPIPDVNYLHAWLLHRLIRIESHEAREFYRVDGVKIADPHAPGANDG